MKRTITGNMIFPALVFFFLMISSISNSATIYVNSTTGNDATGDGTAGNPYKTFHKGYTMASANDILDLTGTFTWTDADETGDAATTGYTIAKNLTIQGQSANETIIQAHETYNSADRRVFTNSTGISLTLSKLTIRHGKVGVDSWTATTIQANNSNVTIISCVISNNISSGTGTSGGPAIYHSGDSYKFIMQNSTANNNGDVTLTYGYTGFATLGSKNAANEITNCTFYKNGGGYNGAIHLYYGKVTVTNSTFIGNRGSVSSTDIHSWGGTAYVKNCIFAQKVAGGSPSLVVGAGGTFVDGGYNIIETQSGAGFVNGVNGNMVGVQANLNISNTLADNGTTLGTNTLALLSGSVAINAGNDSDHNGITIPTTDQRGYFRNGTVDIGAYEYDGTAPTTTWTGASATLYNDWNVSDNWTNGVPNSGYEVTIPNGCPEYPEINGDYNASNPASCMNLTIADAASVTINPGKALTVNGILTVNNDYGLYILADETGHGSLIHNTDNVTGVLEMYYTGSTNLAANQYHFVSIPVNMSNPTSDIFNGFYMYELNPTVQNAGNNNYYGVWDALGTSTTTPLSLDKGYMVYYPGDNTINTFIELLNNGDFSCAVTGHAGTYTFNLVPNPYPSPVNWGELDGWTKSAGIGGTCYVWNASSGNYNNLVSSSDNFIPIGQAFMVAVYDETTPSLTIKNSARTHSSQAFYKSGSETKNQLVINAISNNYADETVVKFSSEATEAFDLKIDGIKLSGLEDAPQLYTLSGNEKYSINNLPVFTEQEIVSMNFETQFAGEVTLTFSNIESFETSLNIYLQDLIEDKTINLRNQSKYTFIHNPQNTANRFNLVFGGTIGIEEPTTQTSEMWISGQTLYINTPEKAGQPALLEVFDASGKVLTSRTVTLDELTTIGLKQQGMIVVRLTYDNNVLTTKGILMK